MVFIFAACLNLEAKLPEKEGIFEFGNNKGYIYLPDNFQKGGNYKFILFFHGAGYSDGKPGNVGHEGFEKFRKMAAEKGRAAKPGLKLGICGEHGGEPSSVEFCHKVGFNYVSCSPFRVPIARLAAALDALRDKENN